MTSERRQVALPLRLVAGVVLALLLTLVAFYILMRPDSSDLRLMALFLSITAVITILASYAAYRFGWIDHAPSLRWALFGTYLLSAILTLINVWVTAQLMFFNDHDLLLATLLLLFAGAIAMSLGYFFTEAFTGRITLLSRSVREIRLSGLETRVHVSGSDEVARLAQAFNEMLHELEESAKRQEELDRMRRELIAWIGHDLQTPLASIRAVIEALVDGLIDDDATRLRYLGTAKRDVGSLSTLIDDLFELAQLDAGGLKLDIGPNSLSDLISDTLESFSALAQERGISLQGNVDGDIDPVSMDVVRIGRVLNNLLSNALRHAPRDGEVCLRASRSGNQVEVEVMDNGEGFAESDIPYLFDRFFRGEKSRSRATGGVGLGLAIARGFVEAHEGRITAHNLPDGGACFRISLPAAH